jgi:hypothetical protein
MIETRGGSKFEIFNSEFEAQLSKQPTYRQAYEATEEIFKEKAGFSQYSSWDSWKNVRSRKLRRR